MSIEKTIEVDVEIEFDDIEDYEICDIIKDRIRTYKIEIATGKNKDKSRKDFSSFIEDTREALGYTTYDVNVEDNRTLLDEEYEYLFKILRNNFSLDEVAAFANSKNK